MMEMDNYHLGGLHPVCWVLGIVLILFIVVFLYKKPVKKDKIESPMDILKRRLAMGAISKEDFEDKKRALES